MNTVFLTGGAGVVGSAIVLICALIGAPLALRAVPPRGSDERLGTARRRSYEILELRRQPPEHPAPCEVERQRHRERHCVSGAWREVAFEQRIA